MAESVERMFPAGTSFALPSGGFLLWVELPEQVDALMLQEQAVGLGVGVAPGVLFSPAGDYRNFIRLNCGVSDSARTRDGLRALGNLVETLAASSDR